MKRILNITFETEKEAQDHCEKLKTQGLEYQIISIKDSFGLVKKGSEFIVRLYDGFDNLWMDITEPIPYDEAMKVLKEKTKNFTKNTSFEDMDYYKIFPADTKMLFS